MVRGTEKLKYVCHRSYSPRHRIGYTDESLGAFLAYHVVQNAGNRTCLRLFDSHPIEPQRALTAAKYQNDAIFLQLDGLLFVYAH